MIDIGRIIDLVKDPDLKLKINELYKENLQLKEENFDLKRKLENTNKFEDLKNKLTHRDNHYFIKEGENEDGPFCTKCLDADSKFIRLHKGSSNSGVEYYRCPNCNSSTTIGTYIPTGEYGGVGWEV